jgi:hypothetical protein
MADMTIRWLTGWRQTAQDRGFRQDAGGWLTPGGQRVSAEFVRRVCTQPDPPAVAVEERRDCA